MVHGPIDGRFIGFYVTVYIKTHKTAQADISVTMPDHRVITTFTLVKLLLSFVAFTKVSVSVYTRKMFTQVSKLSYLSKPFKSKHGRGTQRGYSSKPLNIALLNVV